MAIPENSRQGNIVKLSQQQYINDLIDKFNMSTCNPVSSPLINSKELMVPASSRPTTAPYRQLIGCLQYLSSRTRPDISYAVNFLSKFNKEPDTIHWEAAKRILKYLKGTSDYCVRYSGGTVSPIAYSDADWGNDLPERHSVSGVIVLLANGPILYSYSYQTDIAQSSAEAEYIAANEAVKDIVWLCQFSGELGIKADRALLKIDNQSTIFQIQNCDTRKRSKHVDIKYHYIRQEHKKGMFEIEHVESQQQVADYLTKSLSGFGPQRQ